MTPSSAESPYSCHFLSEYIIYSPTINKSFIAVILTLVATNYRVTAYGHQK